MGSLKKPKIPDQEIVRRYQSGESLGLVTLRVGMSVPWTRARLIANGVELRTLSEASILAGEAGRAQRARLAAKGPPRRYRADSLEEG